MTVFPVGALVTTKPALGEASPWHNHKGHIVAVEPNPDGTVWIYVELWTGDYLDHFATWFADDELIVDCAVDVVLWTRYVRNGRVFDQDGES